MAITRQDFGVTPDGEQVYEYTLTNGVITAEILNYGGIIKNLYVPDKDGNKVDVVLGRDTLEDYLHNDGYLGAIIGRCANRISGAEFWIGDNHYNVGANEGENCLHGGHIGFDRKVWNVKEKDGGEPSLILTLTSPDGDEGFPGKLDVTVTYTVTKNNSIRINYKAVSDKDTVVNLTNHSYFNLSGHDSGEIYDHTLWLNSTYYTPNSSDCIPNGEIHRGRELFNFCLESRSLLQLKGIPCDSIVYGEEGKQLNMFGGYDHNFILKQTSYCEATDEERDRWIEESCKKMNISFCSARVYSDKTDICMDMYTDKPGVQLYTANGLKEGSYKNGAKYGKHNALCLETQYFPNAVNIEHFPSPILKAGEEYNFTTEYAFGIVDEKWKNIKSVADYL